MLDAYTSQVKRCPIAPMKLSTPARFIYGLYCLTRRSCPVYTQAGVTMGECRSSDPMVHIPSVPCVIQPCRFVHDHLIVFVALFYLSLWQDHLRVWLGWSVFGRTLYQQLSSRCSSTSMRDYVAWLKILVTLMFYKCTVKSLFENRNSMFKHLSMEWGLSYKKFMDMWRALLIPKVLVVTKRSFHHGFSFLMVISFLVSWCCLYCLQNGNRTFVNRVMREQRLHYGRMLRCPTHSSISLEPQVKERNEYHICLRKKQNFCKPGFGKLGNYANVVCARFHYARRRIDSRIYVKRAGNCGTQKQIWLTDCVKHCAT
jgi:hypothetical protein